LIKLAVAGYLVAGMSVGPCLPFPLFADRGRIYILSGLAVILPMFGSRSAAIWQVICRNEDVTESQNIVRFCGKLMSR